ncbi:class I SAM-dependent methyltransferase [Candidatus Pelagibacter sp.]|nr:class I SAM-dependent methyltransferase [Candidatus Pelagibacter sp.]
MKIPKTYKIKKCRLCNNNQLKQIYNFGNHFVSNFVNKSSINKGIKAPLNLVYCKKCHLLQLEHSAPQEIMYKKFYWYKSGITKTMRDGLKELYQDIKKNCNIKQGEVILDIGANDGTFLKYFKKDKIITIGCEPANNLKNELKKNCHYVINDFWHTKHMKKIPIKHQKLKVVSAIGMFYDLEDPSEFIKHAADALDDDGIFVAQLMCSHSMFKTNDLGNICHEHLEYYSYNSLKYLFEKNGLKIFKMSENKINGGSYRIYCKKNIRKSINYKERVNYSEIIKFIKRVKQNKQRTLKFIRGANKLGKKIFLYGASTKGNTLLQYYGLTNKEIPFAAERTKVKWGKYTIGSGVKIISEQNARKLKPDYFFVMPYGFINEFIKREKKWLKSGGKFILPYPNFKILN